MLGFIISNGKFIAAILLAVGAYFMGYSGASDKYKLEIKELEIQLLKETIAQQDKAIETTKAVTFGINEIQTNAQKDINDINSSYEHVLDSVLNDHDSASKQVQLPDPATTADRASGSCTCSSPRKNTQSLKELVGIGRDCDLISEKYNRLLKIYTEAQKAGM